MNSRYALLAFSILALSACAGTHEPVSSVPTQTVQGNPTSVDFAEVSVVFKNNRCMNCHSGNNPDAHLNLTVYAQAKAAKDNIRKDVDSGDMPKHGQHLSAGDQAIVDTWVLQGAPDTVTPLSPPTTDDPTDIRFAQVTVVFQNNKCLKCHSSDPSGKEPAAKLDLTQYAQAKAAADDIQKDVHSGKMPKKSNPLDAADLAVIDAWVAAGAPN